MHYPATVGNQAWFRGGRRVRTRWGGAGVAAGLWLLSQLSGCSSSEKNGTSCASLCGDMCKALAACDVEVASDCAGRCATGVAAANCADSRPPDQLTCGELKAAYACADYCATLCTRAPSCGSFDAQLCAQGCTTQSPSICNAASVAARTCDQLKPELRLYEDSARAEQGGSHISHGDFGGTNPYGLCADADDCELPLGCTLITNTCSACAADADCKRAFGPYICSAEKACTKVACASDEGLPRANLRRTAARVRRVPRGRELHRLLQALQSQDGNLRTMPHGCRLRRHCAALRCQHVPVRAVPHERGLCQPAVFAALRSRNQVLPDLPSRC